MQKPHNHLLARRFALANNRNQADCRRLFRLLGGRGGGQSDRLLSRRNELAREEDGVAG